MTDHHEARAREFLNYVVDHHDDRRLTVWGPYRCFDGYALAHLALGRELERGRELVRETSSVLTQASPLPSPSLVTCGVGSLGSHLIHRLLAREDNVLATISALDGRTK